MTRRDLGKIVLFQAAMAKAQTAKKYTGALDGVESKVDANNFDPVHFTNTLYDSAPLRMTWAGSRWRRSPDTTPVGWRSKLAWRCAQILC